MECNIQLVGGVLLCSIDLEITWDILDGFEWNFFHRVGNFVSLYLECLFGLFGWEIWDIIRLE